MLSNTFAADFMSHIFTSLLCIICRLEVNEAILGCCQQLMNAIMILVARSRELQEEIVASGK